MKFIKVNHSLNQTYSVEDWAIKTMIEKILSKITGATLVDIKIHINSTMNGYEAVLKVQKKDHQSYHELTKRIEKEINHSSLNLINSAPDNIKIFF